VTKRLSGISVEHVPEAVDIKTLKWREIAHKFNAGWLNKADYGVDKYGAYPQKIST